MEDSRDSQEMSPQKSVRPTVVEKPANAPCLNLPADFKQVLFIESGFGADQHGQNATKAAARACRNAIEFNSLPAIKQLVPNGYDGLLLYIKIGVPKPETVDKEVVAKVFPYGRCVIDVVEGGLLASSGIAIAALGDKNDDWYIAVAAVTVGY